jgi:hypothetical protein
MPNCEAPATRVAVSPKRSRRHAVANSCWSSPHAARPRAAARVRIMDRWPAVVGTADSPAGTTSLGDSSIRPSPLARVGRGWQGLAPW